MCDWIRIPGCRTFCKRVSCIYIASTIPRLSIDPWSISGELSDRSSNTIVALLAVNESIYVIERDQRKIEVYRCFFSGSLSGHSNIRLELIDVCPTYKCRRSSSISFETGFIPLVDSIPKGYYSSELAQRNYRNDGEGFVVKSHRNLRNWVFGNC